MTSDELRALADCLNDPNAMQRTARRKAADYLRAQADAQPVAWRSKIEGKTKDYWIIQQSEWLAREQPAWEPLYSRAQQMEPAMSNESHPAPAAPQAEPRPCTCHPDDNPPVPCAQKYALSECRAVSGEPTEAQIVAAAKWLDDRLPGYISRTAFASGVLRAALAAK